MGDFFATEFAVDIYAYDYWVEGWVVGVDGFVMRVVVGNFDGSDCSFYGVNISLVVAMIVGVCVEYLA